MKKPDRKEFRREFGSRAPQKFAVAMQKYRKSLKNKKTTGIGPVKDGDKYGRQIAKPTGVGPVRSGEEYGRNLKKPKEDTTVKTKKPVLQNTRPAQAEQKPKAQEPVIEKKGSGISGKFRQSNPPSPTVELPTKRSGRTVQRDPRSRALKTNLNQALSAERRRNQKKAFTQKAKIPMRPPANPKEGDMYRRPFGPKMIYKNGKFVRK